MSQQVFDNRLRPAVEMTVAVLLLILAAFLLLRAGWLSPLMPGMAVWAALGILLLALLRFWQGWQILQYRANLKRLPSYGLAAEEIPLSRHKLFLGKGFQWTQLHSQRLVEARSPAGRIWIQPGKLYQWARALELRHEHNPHLQWLPNLTRSPHWWNPVKPLPPVGGDPALHGVGVEDERDVWIDLGDRVAHTLVLGTTRVGKTRLAELLVTQDIRRGEIVVVFDPKGDTELLARMWAECKRAGRLDQFHIFHLGFPEISERYNPVGSFGRVTEVASRIAGQLPGTGNSATFKEFAWRFTNIVANALVTLGRRPDYSMIARYVTNIEPLLMDYYSFWFEREGIENWREQVNTIAQNIDAKNLPFALKSRDFKAIAFTQLAKSRNLYDPVADGLRSAFEYDKTYFDKLTASLLPLLEKLTTGKSGELLAPNYADRADKRPILDWMAVIRQRGVVYVGLDALSDVEVAGAVGNSMFADLTSIAGQLYKHGDNLGLPELAGHKRAKIAIHADEFNELVGNEFIPLLNKAGGSGVQVTAYTQTASDIEAGIGEKPKAGQIQGNLNTLIMLRVKNEETAAVLTDQLAKVRIYTKTAQSAATDNNDPDSCVDFTSSNSDRITEAEADILTPADLVQLPKGQAFALLDGGKLYKLRLPLAGADPLLPNDMDTIIRWVRETRLGEGG
ncbi:MAG: type IV conjugative transfer system coupling protein TraD [Gammaproteobacteria bacterium]|nr:type IV conjugative transfer system coupling protein TraD [Gammaproteobacteria bacterium]